LIGVKVLDADGGGSNSQVLAGIDWVTQDVTNSNMAGKAVINMSLGGGRSRAMNAAVTAATRAGITVVVAAGNEAVCPSIDSLSRSTRPYCLLLLVFQTPVANATTLLQVDARNDSPASAPLAITVGAIDSADTQASFSNFGPVVDVFAPGVDVLSAAITSTSASRVLSGTSMAAPHIAGLCAYLITLEGLTTPEEVQARVKALAVEGGGVVRDAGAGTVAGIAYNGSGL
jgi:subtilisin family serine protease